MNQDQEATEWNQRLIYEEIKLYTTSFLNEVGDKFGRKGPLVAGFQVVGALTSESQGDQADAFRQALLYMLGIPGNAEGMKQ